MGLISLFWDLQLTFHFHASSIPSVVEAIPIAGRAVVDTRMLSVDHWDLAQPLGARKVHFKVVILRVELPVVF